LFLAEIEIVGAGATYSRVVKQAVRTFVIEKGAGEFAYPQHMVFLKFRGSADAEPAELPGDFVVVGSSGQAECKNREGPRE
jgi:hypothetical protein